MSSEDPTSGASHEHSGKARVCLITSGHVASNPRLVKEASALQRAEYLVRVVSTNLFPWADLLDAGVFHDLGCEHVRIDLRKPRWRHLARAVRQRFARAFFRCFSGGTLSRTLAIWAHHPITSALSAAAARVPADLYLAHNLAALPAAVWAAEARGTACGFDAEDFHCGELTESPVNALELRMRTAIEAAFLPRCRHLTASAPLIAHAYRKRYGVDMESILNVFSLAEAPESSTKSTRAPGAEPSLYWFSQTVGAERGLENVVRAMAQMRVRAWLRLRGNPAEGYPQSLRDLAHREGGDDLAGRIEFLPIAAPGEMARLAAEHDLGLAVENPWPPNRGFCLTNKLFTYLLGGVPVCLSRTPAQELLAAELGDAARLVDIDDPHAFARSLDEQLSDMDRLTQRRKTALALARDRFNWEVEQTRFLSLVERSLSLGQSKP